MYKWSSQSNDNFSNRSMNFCLIVSVWNVMMQSRLSSDLLVITAPSIFLFNPVILWEHKVDIWTKKSNENSNQMKIQIKWKFKSNILNIFIKFKYYYLQYLFVSEMTWLMHKIIKIAKYTWNWFKSWNNCDAIFQINNSEPIGFNSFRL